MYVSTENFRQLVRPAFRHHPPNQASYRRRLNGQLNGESVEVIMSELKFQKGKRYLVWDMSDLSWTVRGKQSSPYELKCLEISKSGAIKFKNIYGHIYWVNQENSYKIKEQL